MLEMRLRIQVVLLGIYPPLVSRATALGKLLHCKCQPRPTPLVARQVHCNLVIEARFYEMVWSLVVFE